MRGASLPECEDSLAGWVGPEPPLRRSAGQSGIRLAPFIVSDDRRHDVMWCMHDTAADWATSKQDPSCVVLAGRTVRSLRGSLSER